MKRLARLREKTYSPLDLSPTELTEAPAVSSGRYPSAADPAFSPGHASGLAGPGDHAAAAPRPSTRSMVAVGAVPTTKPGSLWVPYQRIWFDFAVDDGEYSPEDLRRARKVVKAWGPVRFYTLTTPEG